MSEAQSWSIDLTPRAQRELCRAPAAERTRIVAALNVLRAGPGHGDVRKLQGQYEEWRLRVGNWRVRFYWDHDARVVAVLWVLPRATAYRD